MDKKDDTIKDLEDRIVRIAEDLIERQGEFYGLGQPWAGQCMSDWMIAGIKSMVNLNLWDVILDLLDIPKDSQELPPYYFNREETIEKCDYCPYYYGGTYSTTGFIKKLQKIAKSYRWKIKRHESHSSGNISNSQAVKNKAAE